MLEQSLARALSKGLDDMLADVLREPPGTPVERAALAQLEPVPAIRSEVLQFRWIKEQLARFTYKAGWRFDVLPDVVFGMGYFQTSFKCEDTYNPGVMTEVCKRVPLYSVPYGNPEVFARWLEAEIQDVEIHESREWLKRDGVIYNNPHA
jgi:hypothetical protein